MRETGQEHVFKGKWITTEEFANKEPRNVFHGYLEKGERIPADHLNRHILFRKEFFKFRIKLRR